MPYVASTLGTYSTGTVTVVNGSTAVTGSGTVWGDIVNEGDLFTIDDDKFYYVAALNSDTSLTLDKPYAEASASGVGYRVMLNTAAHFPSDVAAKVERALSGMGDVYCPIDHASSGSDYGLASASLYGHAKASGTTPKAPGTAAVGTETNKFARGDHVHPLQTIASTPATTDNSTKIATTAFVNNRLPYITGTWTPTIYGSTTNGQFTYETNNGGRYLKLGKIVFVFGSIVATCVSIPSGSVQIGGLPFNAAGYGYRLWTTNNSSIEGFWLRYNVNYAIARVNTSNAGNSPLYFNSSSSSSMSCDVGTTLSITITGFYETNS